MPDDSFGAIDIVAVNHYDSSSAKAVPFKTLA
jgi:hypothetical protein